MKEGDKYRSMAHRLREQADLQSDHAIGDQYRKIALALLALMLFISVALGFGLSQIMLAPVRAIRATASCISWAERA